ncbi:endonuclease/exonuclease/phosphatase family protein [Aurantiacibacter sp. MUD61]|uniref:endonuclease/exonuclease/phosphatase family protein n=1 Tax=Aurantiacibacter sp. MUD61 TaxID=3009083 RepID=UPI0022F0C4F0|nr:endonuclease/exonuclease/phosphatase family protein [Aurantiacibacter sp. MUD61]
MTIWIARFARLLIILGVIATIVALVAADKWWIRSFDFPRLQIAVLLVLALATLFVLRAKRLVIWSAIGVLALAFQLYQIFPYSALASKQAVDAERCDPVNALSIVSLNVLQSNTDYQRTIDYVLSADPDIFLAMENDQAWTDALSAALDERYPHSMKIPLDNTYGMALWSRFELVGAERNQLAGGGTPSIRTRLRREDGSLPTLFAVHPRPPSPGQDSGQRDAELVLLADLVRESGRPTVVIGDFNDVGWSRVTETFQRIGQVVDPRIGRGFHATFNARNPLMRWPLDHVFHTDDFGVIRFAVGPDVGSDHFPLEVDLCQQRARFSGQQAAPELTEEAIDDAREELEAASKGGEGPDAENLTLPDGDEDEAFSPVD